MEMLDCSPWPGSAGHKKGFQRTSQAALVARIELLFLQPSLSARWSHVPRTVEPDPSEPRPDMES
jgi:hypothetical protein